MPDTRRPTSDPTRKRTERPSDLGVLVLAAGNSTRARPVAGGRPKVLMEVGGASILERNLKWLSSWGIRTAWINLHYEADQVQDSIGTGAACGLSVRYSHERTLLGTAGAFRNLAAEWDDTVLVVYGDNLIRFDLDRFLARHVATAADATIAVFLQDRHLNTGIAGGRTVLGPDGRVIRFTEGVGLADQPVNAGAYLLERSVVSLIPPSSTQDFGHDTFPSMLERDARVFGYEIEPGGYCLGFDTPESYARGMSLITLHHLTLS